MKIQLSMIDSVAENVFLYTDPDYLNPSRVLFAGPKSRKAPKPKVGVYPKALKDKAKAVWDDLIVTYERKLTEIRKAHNTDWEYACAIIILRKLCIRQGLASPFDAIQQRREVSVAFRRVAGVIYRRVHKGVKLATKIQKSLVKSDLMDQVGTTPKYLLSHSPRAKTYALDVAYPVRTPGRSSSNDIEEVLTKKVPSTIRFKKSKGVLGRLFEDTNSKGKKQELISLQFHDGNLVLSIRFTEAEAVSFFGDPAGIKSGAISSLNEFGRKNNGYFLKTVEQELGPYAEMKSGRGRA